jgi:hypothetical protein
LPQITITANPKFPFSLDVPRDYQPFLVDRLAAIVEPLGKQIDIFEQDFIELTNLHQVDEYTQLLLTSAAEKGATRDIFVTNITNKAEGITGSVAFGDGAQATVGTINYSQVWERNRDSIDLPELARQLHELNVAVEARPPNETKPNLMRRLAAAIASARAGDGPKTLELIAAAGVEILVLGKTLGLELVAKTAAEVVAPMGMQSVIAALPSLGHLFVH